VLSARQYSVAIRHSPVLSTHQHSVLRAHQCCVLISTAHVSVLSTPVLIAQQYCARISTHYPSVLIITHQCSPVLITAHH